MRHRRQLLPGGFTLIELAVVLVLMALLASAVAVSARGMIGGASRAGVLAQVGAMDAQARRHARQTGRAVQLEVDTADHRITLRDNTRNDAAMVGQYRAPSGYAFSQAWRLRRGTRDKQDRLLLLYDPHGTTSTWGVTLTTPEGDDDAVLVLGMTGQTTIWENDEAARDILAQARRRDTD